MKRTGGPRTVAVAAILAAAACGALATTATAAPAPATSPSAASAPAATVFCLYTPRGSISHYFSLATGERVVKGHYDHGQTFLIASPPVRSGLDGITYWKLPNGFWIDSSGILRVSGPCATT